MYRSATVILILITLITFDFFSQPQNLFQKQYEALRMYYFEKIYAKEAAKKFGNTYPPFYV